MNMVAMASLNIVNLSLDSTAPIYSVPLVEFVYERDLLDWADCVRNGLQQCLLQNLPLDFDCRDFYWKAKAVGGSLNCEASLLFDSAQQHAQYRAPLVFVIVIQTPDLGEEGMFA